MMVRKKFTIPEEELRAAEEYARLTHRNLSALIREALVQMMNRYPRKTENGHENSLAKKISDLEEKVSWLYSQVLSGANPKGVTESKNGQ